MAANIYHLDPKIILALLNWITTLCLELF